MKTSIIFLTVIFWFVGCNQDETTMPTDAASSYFTISPSDNQSSVTQSTTITLTFSKELDKSVVEKNFRLMNERSYRDTLCPASSTMGHGSMINSMMDSIKMNHLGSIHGLKGTFVWSADSKTCTFRPDTLLLPGMQHMVHLREGISTMMENNFGSMGMMGRSGMGNGMGMTFHFTTKSSGNSDGGHDSHHQ
jgi:hypothetical protein